VAATHNLTYLLKTMCTVLLREYAKLVWVISNRT